MPSFIKTDGFKLCPWEGIEWETLRHDQENIRVINFKDPKNIKHFDRQGQTQILTTRHIFIAHMFYSYRPL